MSSVQIKDRIANLKQNKKNLPKLVTAENKDEGMNNMGETYFVASENNFDLNQAQNMLSAKNQMINDVHSNKKNMQAIASIKDSTEYLGCLNNKCSNINENNSGQNIDNKINDTDSYNNKVVKKNTNKRIQNHNLNNYLNMQNELHKKMSANPDYIKNLLPNLDTVITTVYILLMSILIIYSLVGKNNNLVSILVFTLVFIFYKNIVAYNNKYKK
tara:strand:+ start:1845 stop:2489 length:645 start_codon:yes stop_codon:yes gene_type:complete